MWALDMCYYQLATRGIAVPLDSKINCCDTLIINVHHCMLALMASSRHCYDVIISAMLRGARILILPLNMADVTSYARPLLPPQVSIKS